MKSRRSKLKLKIKIMEDSNPEISCLQNEVKRPIYSESDFSTKEEQTIFTPTSDGSIKPLKFHKLFLMSSVEYLRLNCMSSEKARSYGENFPDLLKNRSRHLIEHCFPRWEDSANIPNEDIDDVGQGQLLVKSRNGSSLVQFLQTNTGLPHCDCLGWNNSHLICKHFMAVLRNSEQLGWMALPVRYREYSLLNLDLQHFEIIDDVPMLDTVNEHYQIMMFNIVHLQLTFQYHLQQISRNSVQRLPVCVKMMTTDAASGLEDCCITPILSAFLRYSHTSDHGFGGIRLYGILTASESNSCKLDFSTLSFIDYTLTIPLWMVHTLEALGSSRLGACLTTEPQKITLCRAVEHVYGLI
ncbi:unnamed protein product [Mytilus coruscus]|uniref:SWIM-type domain-containing protein n=1 Tax=Mytilus coruscus TaxID=42192 RepID=A0A6J8AEX7_MYTCO|nr:unnamed protein product [Mytilus coruscus]